MSAIRTKEEFYGLYMAGKLGNKLRNWDWDSFCAEGFDGPPGAVYAVRYMIPGSPWCKYDMERHEAIRYVDELVECNGASWGKFIFSECAPDNDLTMQGEMMRAPNGEYCGWYMRYSTTPGLRMREAFARPTVQELTGVSARLYAKEKMDAASWDCLNDLFDEYPDAVIEFATYRRHVGDRGWNTLFWEVRNY